MFFKDYRLKCTGHYYLVFFVFVFFVSHIIILSCCTHYLVCLFVCDPALNVTLFYIIDFTDESGEINFNLFQGFNMCRQKHTNGQRHNVVYKKYDSDNKLTLLLHVICVKPLMSVVLHSNTLRDVRKANVLTADANHIREVFK